MKKNKHSLTDFWVAIKWPLYALWESHKIKREKVAKNIFEKIMTKTF